MSNQQDRLRETLSALHSSLRQAGKGNPSYAKIIIHDMLSKIKEQLQLLHPDLAESFHPLPLTSQITNHKSLNDIMPHLEQELLRLSAAVSRQGSGLRHAIERAKKYIDEHYTEENIRLDEIARIANMSTSYFCIIFKQEIGKTFTDHLTSLRIRRACDLLLTTNYRSNEISYMVGYSSHSYFCTVFKKATGHSPNAYRNLHGKAAR